MVMISKNQWKIVLNTKFCDTYVGGGYIEFNVVNLKVVRRHCFQYFVTIKRPQIFHRYCVPVNDPDKLRPPPVDPNHRNKDFSVYLPLGRGRIHIVIGRLIDEEEEDDDDRTERGSISLIKVGPSFVSLDSVSVENRPNVVFIFYFIYYFFFCTHV